MKTVWYFTVATVLALCVSGTLYAEEPGAGGDALESEVEAAGTAPMAESGGSAASDGAGSDIDGAIEEWFRQSSETLDNNRVLGKMRFVPFFAEIICRELARPTNVETVRLLNGPTKNKDGSAPFS